MAINLKPFRVYDEHDVVNLYAYSGAIGISAGDKIPKGTLVKVQGDGWKNTDWAIPVLLTTALFLKDMALLLRLVRLALVT